MWAQNLFNLLSTLMPSIKSMDATDIKAYTKQLKFFTDRAINKTDIELLTKIIKDWVSTQKDLYFRIVKPLDGVEQGFSVFMRYK